MPNTPFALDSGERLLWSGCPRQGMILGSPDFFFIPFSFVFGGFVLNWNAMAWSNGSPLFFRLFGLPFLFVGLYIMFGRFLVDARIRQQTSYAVTNQRVLISTGILNATLRSYDLALLSDVSVRKVLPDGTGTITFSGSPFPPLMGFAIPLPVPGLTKASAFQLIADVNRVHDILLGAQQAAAGVTASAA